MSDWQRRLLWVVLWLGSGGLFSGCSYLIGDENAQRLRAVREELYQESRHHRLAVGQVTHTFESSDFRDAIKTRFEEDIPITPGKNIAFEYSINHILGWITDLTHYAFTIEGTSGDVLTMSHTNFTTGLNFYLWRAFGSELAIGAGIGQQYLQREYLSTSSRKTDTKDKLMGQSYVQYNQVITNGIAFSYTARYVYIDPYIFDNPNSDDLNVVSSKKVNFRSGGAQVAVNFYFPFFTKPRQ